MRFSYRLACNSITDVPQFGDNQSVRMDMVPVRHHSLRQLDPDAPTTEKGNKRKFKVNVIRGAFH